MIGAVLVAVRGHNLMFSDGAEVRLPEEVNVRCPMVEDAQPVGAIYWKLLVPGRKKSYTRGVLLHAGTTYRVAVEEVAYLRRCIKQESEEFATEQAAPSTSKKRSADEAA